MSTLVLVRRSRETLKSVFRSSHRLCERGRRQAQTEHNSSRCEHAVQKQMPRPSDCTAAPMYIRDAFRTMNDVEEFPKDTLSFQLGCTRNAKAYFIEYYSLEY